MKKERIVLFPGHEASSLEKRNTNKEELHDIAPGKAYRIGKPSNRYYEHIHPTLEPGQMTVSDFEGFRRIKGTIVIVTSILRMKNGDRIAVLRTYDDTFFMDEIKKIFAFIKMSLAREELIALDLEAQRMLQLDMP